ncbi:hypothetical protein [Pyxidicoccus xibeiensis]|uniref:hypothetical protein n=1 Tax=Pyxidicoccus xibeiensis TaxID=2906759 RepID=UPI0020A7D5FA|nr:hypothetical protein [Pyxidicoccus xibeiensis]MCP3139457.1 hypothetical protein [Pyxidicoccus xibeiensis]
MRRGEGGPYVFQRLAEQRATDDSERIEAGYGVTWSPWEEAPMKKPRTRWQQEFAPARKRNEALRLFRERLLALHPRAEWPEWVDSSVIMHLDVPASGKSTFSLQASPDPALAPGLHWEEVNGSRMLVSIDKETGKRGVIIHWSTHPSEIVTLFSAVLDDETSQVTVLVDNDFSKLEGAKFYRVESYSGLTRCLWHQLAEDDE